MVKNILVFSLTANTTLTDKVCEELEIDRSVSEIKHFADGECIATPGDVDVRGKKIYIIQSTCKPVNDRIMETLIFIDACKRANCREITLIIPYFGYARQDRIARMNEPITARLVADLFTNAGVKRVVVVELHTPQIQGFFGVPVDNLSPSFLFAKHLERKFNKLHYDYKNVAIVAPDHGAMHRARDLANFLPSSNIVVIDKRRPRPNVAEITNIVGDIQDKVCVMIDDIIDTGGTILAGAKALKDRGAKEVYICVSHALFNGDAIEKFKSADYVDRVYITDTVEHPEFKDFPRFHVISVAPMIADVIRSHESHEKIRDEYARFH